MAANLMVQGLELMLAGMGTVFVFLTALVGATTLMSRLVMRYLPSETAGDEPDAEEIAVITAAIAEHRRGRRG
jgi:oxaloacetate decarboxylase gamma subunit